MALSFNEKRALQKAVAVKTEELKNSSLSFKEKRAAHKELKEAFAKLLVKVEATDGEKSQKLSDLIAGKYNSETPQRFLAIVKEVVEELSGEIEPVKPPVIGYIQANAEQVMESAPELVDMIEDMLQEGAHDAATSPENDLPEPTPAQIAAGNYKKGKMRLHGLDIVIENPAGSVRRGVSPDGVEWETKLAHHYGYFSRTEGKDGDHVDVFVGPDEESPKAYVIDQVNQDGSFDEHKTLLGMGSMEEAKKGYLDNYDEGWTGLGAVTEMSIGGFKDWLAGGKKKHPVGILNG